MNRLKRTLAAVLALIFTFGVFGTTAAVASPGVDGIAEHHNDKKDHDKDKDKKKDKDEKKKDKDKDEDNEGYPM